MAKGFTDSKGNFRPTGNNGRKSSREKSIQPDGSTLKIIKFKVWKYDDAPEEVQEKIIEKLRNDKFEFGDTFFAEDQGLIFDDDEKKEATDIGLNMPFPEFFDVDSNRGTDFVQFRDLKIEDEDKFAKYLGINKKLQNKINFQFDNDNNRDMSNTTLEVVTPTGDVIDTNTSRDDREKFDESKDLDNDIGRDEFDKIFNAIIKFDNLMSMAEQHLRRNYEFQFEEETLAEDARANEYDFDEDGKIV